MTTLTELHEKQYTTSRAACRAINNYEKKHKVKLVKACINQLDEDCFEVLIFHKNYPDDSIEIVYKVK